MKGTINWSHLELRELGEWRGGGTPSKSKKEYWKNGTIPWVSPKDMKRAQIETAQDLITEEAVKGSATNLVPPGSILLVTRSGILQHSLPAAVTTSTVALNQDIKSLVPNEAANSDFLYFGFRNFERTILKECCKAGTTVQSIEFPRLLEFKFPLPPLNEQKRIVAKIEELFSELDAGVASLKQARTQLGTYRQALLKQAFEGKLTAQWRRDHPDKLESPEKLLTRIQEERETRYQTNLQTWETAVEEWEANGNEGKKPSKPRKQKPSEEISPNELKSLTDLPENWIYARLGESIVGIDAGKSFSCEERRPTQNEIGVAKVSAVTWGEYDEAESKTCRDVEKINPAYFIEKGDFILSRANTIDLVGATVIVRRTTQRIMLSDKTLRIRFAGVSQDYVLLYLRSRIGRLQIMSRSTGNQESMRNIGQDRISAIVTPLCSLPEQREIVRLLEEQFTAIEQNEREIETSLRRAEALRQSILKRAFSGQLVPQDPSDEPATTLLARIQQERNERAAQAPKKPKKKAAKKARKKEQK